LSNIGGAVQFHGGDSASFGDFNTGRAYAIMLHIHIMKYWLISCLAAGLYLLTGGILLRQLLHGRAPETATRAVVLLLGVSAALLQAAVLYGSLRLDAGLNLAITNAASLIMWAVVLLFLATALYKPVDNLGIIIMPLAAIAILSAWLLPGRPVIVRAGSSLEFTHIVISVLAYGLLTLAAVQGLLLLAQERHLRQRQPGAFLRALPPMETMEQLMFQLIGVGFVLLTLTLVSGLLFSEQVFGQPLRFNHHMVLSLLAWVVFGVLLLGRWRFGWRGRPAVRWTLSGFTLLALAYFGSKFVLEIILHR
jgi:ABC-type uncharacterized transport system permease subunit